MKLRSCSTRRRPASRSSSACSARVELAPARAAERHGDRVDGEVPAREILLERARAHLRQRARRRVGLGAPLGDVDAAAVPLQHGRAEALVKRRAGRLRGARRRATPRQRAARGRARRRRPPPPRRARAGARPSSRSRTAPPTSASVAPARAPAPAARGPPGRARSASSTSPPRVAAAAGRTPLTLAVPGASDPRTGIPAAARCALACGDV